MTETKDYIDITPADVPGGKGVKGLQNTVFQETDWAQILDNPERLTKEGIEKKIELWKQSSNSHVRIKYATMLKRCKSIAKSGMTEDGRIIFSRSADGEPKWVSDKKINDPSRTEVKKGK